MDGVAHGLNGFPTAAAAEFRAPPVAIGTSGPDAATPAPLDRCPAAHPIATAFLTAQKSVPVGDATLAYFGVNAPRFPAHPGPRLGDGASGPSDHCRAVGNSRRASAVCSAVTAHERGQKTL